MIWIIIAIVWSFLTVAITLVSYIDLKLSARLMTTKQCFNSSLLKGLFSSTVILAFMVIITVDWAELLNYRAFGG